MKKIATSIALITALSLGLGADDTLNTSNVEKPKRANMLKELNDAKRSLKKQNKDAKVYTGTAGVDASPDSIDYFDYLTSAYNQAVLDLKAQLVLRKSGTAAFNEAFRLIDTRVPDENLRKQLKEEAENKIKSALDRDDMNSFFGAINNLIDKAFGKDLDKEERKKIEVEVKKQVFKKAFEEGFNKQASDEISGLVPYENYIVTNENGEVQVGVLAYTTQRSISLARDLRNANQSKKTENKEQCKSAEDIADSLSNEELLSKFGIKYFYNENCHPSLLAYGLDTYKNTTGMNSDYERISIERARGMADKFISNFLSSNITAIINDKKVADKSIEAMMNATYDDGKTSFSALKNSDKSGRTSITKQMSQEFNANSSMDLIGLEDARIWSVDKDDYTVVGVIRYYSADSIEASKEEFKEPKEESFAKPKPTKSHNPSIKHSKNLDVTDF